MSSKQEAASSSTQLAPQGPLWAREQHGSRNQKKCHHAVRDGAGKTNTHLLGRKAHVLAAKVLHVCKWPSPRRAPGGAPSRPKMAHNHQKGARCLRGGGQKVPLSNLMDQINLGTVWVSDFWPCFGPCGPETVSVGPKKGSFGPRMCPAG